MAKKDNEGNTPATWLTIGKLAALEGTTPRQIYNLIDKGLAHCRVGARIRVRRCDWDAFHEANMISVPQGAE